MINLRNAEGDLYTINGQLVHACAVLEAFRHFIHKQVDARPIDGSLERFTKVAYFESFIAEVGNAEREVVTFLNTVIDYEPMVFFGNL